MKPNNPVLNLAGASANGSIDVTLESNAKGVLVFINRTAAGTGTTPTFTLTINDVVPDSASPENTVSSGLSSAALDCTTTGITTLAIYPGLPVTANVSANGVVPRTINLSYAIGGTTPTVNVQVSVVSLA